MGVSYEREEHSWRRVSVCKCGGTYWRRQGVEGMWLWVKEMRSMDDEKAIRALCVVFDLVTRRVLRWVS
jgi:hypothetical protein